MMAFLKKYTLLFATVFILTIGLAGTALAWSDNSDHIIDGILYSRKMIWVFSFFMMILSALLALFKKISWFWLFSFLCYAEFFNLILWVIVLIWNHYRSTLIFDNNEIYLLFVHMAVFLSIILTPLIQYRRKKIDKKLLKHRFFILFMAFPVLIICAFIIFLMILYCSLYLKSKPGF